MVGPLLARLLDPHTGPMYPGPSVCPLQKFSYFLSLLFSAFLQQVSYLDSSPHYLQLFYSHHGRENSSSPIFLAKKLISYKEKSLFGHFIENASLVSAEISYLYSAQHYLQLFYLHHCGENSSSPIF